MFEIAAAMLLAGVSVAAQAFLVLLLLVLLAFWIDGRTSTSAAHIPGTAPSTGRAPHGQPDSP